jgi:hypothetical protein
VDKSCFPLCCVLGWAPVDAHSLYALNQEKPTTTISTIWSIRRSIRRRTCSPIEGHNGATFMPTSTGIEFALSQSRSRYVDTGGERNDRKPEHRDHDSHVTSMRRHRSRDEVLSPCCFVICGSVTQMTEESKCFQRQVSVPKRSRGSDSDPQSSYSGSVRRLGDVGVPRRLKRIVAWARASYIGPVNVKRQA